MERTFPEPDADEWSMLNGWLDWQRATVHKKVAGLSDDNAYRSLLPSSPTVTVAGVVSHLRWTEHTWFAGSFPSLVDGDVPTVEDRTGWTFEWQPLRILLDEYDAECRRSREVVRQLDLADMQEFTPPQFRPVTLRWILSHMIEETARHVGHLDIIRELTDGTKGY